MRGHCEFVGKELKGNVAAAQQVVADLFDLLARGGSVTVHIEELGGKEYMLEGTAQQRRRHG